MSFECKTNYSASNYAEIAFKLLSGLINNNKDYEVWIRKHYPEDADDIIPAISKLLSTNDPVYIIDVLEGRRTAAEGQFGPQWQASSELVEDPRTISVENVPLSESRTDSLGTKGSFIAESNNPKPIAAYSKMIDDFKTHVVESIFYDPESKRLRDPEFVRGQEEVNLLNKVLYQYKIELMNKLYKKLYGEDSHYSINLKDTEESFTNTLNKLLSDYQTKKGTLDKNGEVFAEYMILKNFDSLIVKEFKTIIQLKSKFEDSDRKAVNMYDYLGSKVEYDDTYGEEYADASDYSSPIIKILLNYFHGRETVSRTDFDQYGRKKTVNYDRDTDKVIGFATFSNLMTRVKEWAETTGEQTMRDIIYGDVNTNWVRLITRFIDANKASLTTDELSALKGISYYLFANEKNVDGTKSETASQLKRMFVSQAKKTVKYRHLIVAPKYNSATHRVEMTTTELSDRLIDIQNFTFQGNIKNAVLRFRRDPKQFENLLSKLNITIEKDGTITFGKILSNKDDLIVHVTESAKEIKVDFDPISVFTFDDNKVINVIQSILGVPIPNDVNTYIATMQNVSDLLSVFLKPLAITLYASSMTTTKTESSDYKSPIRFEDGILVTYPFVTLCDNAAILLSKIFGTTDTNVVRNDKGNALPSYQITSSVYEVKHFIWEINKGEVNLRNGIHSGKRKTRVFKRNILARDHGTGKSAIGQVYNRGDIMKDGISKSSNNLTAKEVYSTEIAENFVKRILAGKSIILQPIVFSDKKTHFLIEYNTDSILINAGIDAKTGKTIQRDLASALVDLVGTDEANRLVAQTQILKEIKAVRGDRVREQLIDIMKRYEKAFKLYAKSGWILMSDGINNDNLKSNLTYLRNFLHSIRSIDTLRNAFGDEVDLNESLDFTKYNLNGETHFDVNLTLLHEAEMYLFDSKSFDRYWNEQKRQLAKSLKKAKFKFDYFHDPSLTEIIGMWKKALGETWYDDNSRTMSPFIAFKDGKITTDLDNADTIELHPIVEAYMLADGLLSEQFNELLFGATNGFADKYKGQSLEEEEIRHAERLKQIETIEDKFKKNAASEEENIKHIRNKDNIFIQSTAAKLGDQFKRTVLAGAIRTPYETGLRYGLSSEGLVSVVDDLKGNSYNYLGINTTEDANDGSGNASAYTCIQENESLGDAAVGNIKKTFLNYTDPATGTLYEIKWAEFPIFNDYRRGSMENERKYQKMHSVKEINVADMQNFNISKFYNLNEIEYDEIDGRRITHNDTLYRRDGVTGNYYRINSVRSAIENVNGQNRWVVYVSESLVKKDGPLTNNNSKEVKGPETLVETLPERKVVIKYVSDLDAVFGGKNCMEYNKVANKLVWSDAQNYIVNNIICNHNLKKHYIAFVVNKSAMKVGPTNVNDKRIFSNSMSDKKLKYFEMSFKHAGVQMNADHEIDESMVSEMSQMISALIQGGMAKGTVQRIYHLIGQIASENLKRFTRILDNPNAPTFNDDLYIKIGKLFASSFVDGGKDDIGLAEAFIINASKALKYNITDNKIPFSSNQIKGIFQATMSSTLNKLGIRRKFPGFGGINSPSYENMQLYSFGNGSYGFFDEYQDYIRDRITERRNNGETISNFWNAETVFNYQMSNPKSGIIDNPFITEISINTNRFNDFSSKIGIEDTVVIRKKGELGEGELIRIRDIKTLDYIKHLLPTGNFEIYKWETQPRELRQSQDTVTTDTGITLNWTDLDWVRANFYLTDGSLLTDELDWLPIEQVNSIKDLETVGRNLVIYNALRGSGIDWLNGTISKDIEKKLNGKWKALRLKLEGSGILWDSNEALVEKRNLLRNLALKWTQNQIQDFAIKIGKGLHQIEAPTSLNITGPITISFYNKASGQIIMGRANAKVLGLRKGDTIREIKEKGSSFFEERLKHKYQLPLHSEVNPRQYDAVLYNTDGDKTLVVIGSVKTNIDRLQGCNPDRNYVVNSNFMYEKNDTELFSSSGKAFYVNENGYNVLVVENEAALQEVIDSKYYSFIRYKYNRYNWKKLLMFLHPDAFDANGNTKTNIKFGHKTFTAASINSNDLSIELSEEENNQNIIRIGNLAEKQYQAFESQLNYILTRIPAQSMQSFMDVTVESWVDSIMNEVYVPRALTWIQGSDYDIDKDYMMGFGLLPDGTLATLSDLDKDYNSYEVLLLQAPDGREFTTRNMMYGEDAIALDNNFVQEVLKGKVSLLNKVLTQQRNVIIFKSEVSNEDREKIKKLVNIHNKSRRFGKRQLLGLQNTVVRGILEVLRSPATQINMGKPIAMKNIRAIAVNSTLAQDEKVMTLDNSFTKFMMQEQNMVGREVIGIGAVSLKHFFAASTFMNQQITKMEQAARTGDVAKIVPLLMDIIYNSKIGKYDSKIGKLDILTLANLDFSTLLEELKKNPTRFAAVLIDENKFKTDANSNLFNSPFFKDGKLFLTSLVEYLNEKSNGTWDSPIDAAYALSELISAATDNAKELILSKINATTKFADVYTYLLTTGKSFKEISDIMMSPIFNIVAYYAQGNLYDNLVGNADLETALKFVLDLKALKGIDDKKFLWLITNPKHEGNDEFVPWVVRMMFKRQGLFVDKTNDLENNFVRRWYMSKADVDTRRSLTASGQKILEFIQDVYENRWNDEAFDYTEDYKSFVKACYDELMNNPEAQEELLNMLREKISGESEEEVPDPDSISFDFLDYENDIEYDEEYYSNDSIVDGLQDFSYSDLSVHNARVFYKYITEYLIPKNNELRELNDGKGPSEQEIQNLKDLLDNVLPAMREQQINGQILGINQGLKTDDYGEQNWVRKLENFVNQRYIQGSFPVDTKDLPDFEFNLIRFLSDQKYREKQIAWYEKVKSSINILKNISNVEHFWQMLQTVGTNRSIIERSAAIRVERDLVDRVLKEAKKKSRGISSGYFYKFTAKEFKELQRTVSDYLVLNWVASLKGLSIDIPKDYGYFNGTHFTNLTNRKGIKSLTISIGDKVNVTEGKLNPVDFIASFKFIMDEYIIPTLVANNPNNEFLRSLTTGFRKDALTGEPITFWKPAINLSDSVKSAKLSALYEPIARDFNKIIDMNASDMGLAIGDNWTIGDLFYLYNVIVHRDSIGGNSFTKLFEELTVANNRNSLVYSYNHFLGELDNGEYRWKEPMVNGSIVSYGDYLHIDLKDIRYRCAIEDSSEKKFKLSRTKSKNGKSIEKITLKTSDNKTDGVPEEPRKTPRSFYILNLPYIGKENLRIWTKSIKLAQAEKVEFDGNSKEILFAIADVVRDILGPAIPIEIVDKSILTDIKEKKLVSDLKVEDRMLNNPAFLYNGKIYINSDEVDLESPVHELMHIVCAVLKYGNRAQKALYYQLLDSIKEDSEEWIKRFNNNADDWKAFLDIYAKEYSDILVGSDLKEELLVKALTKNFTEDFEQEWNNYDGINTNNLNRIVRSILEDVLKIEHTGELAIEDLLKAPIKEILGVFRSQFNRSNVYNLASTVIPTNQALAKLKKKWIGDKNLTIEGDC